MFIHIFIFIYRLLCSVNPKFRCLVLGIITVGFYYSTQNRRTGLEKIWRNDISKISKLRSSVSVWALKLGVDISSGDMLVDLIIDFLMCCWKEGDKYVKLIKLDLNSKVLSDVNIIDSSVIGRKVIYREDLGDIDDDKPKKKLKKKTKKLK
jgi:hypothetical protein